MKIKEKILQYFHKNKHSSVTREYLAKEMKISKEERPLFFSVLLKMEKENLLYKKRNGEYCLARKKKQFEGILHTHKKGFGFISVEDQETDYFVRQPDMNGALDGDAVLFEKIIDKMYPDKEAAKIVKVNKRANHRQVGTLISGNKKYFFLELDNANFQGKILLNKSENPQLVIGHKVVVVPEEYLANGEVIGRLVEVLGHLNTPGIDILAIVKQFDIETEFSFEVEQQVESIPSEVLQEELVNREDIRERLTITIDGADAKDLDDAISLRKLENGNHLLSVHIADVSHYVTTDSAIDQTALARGTSVYLADRVIPMLPIQLSNGICSLHPGMDRLAISCDMEIDKRGLIVQKKIYQSVIYSDERMTYDDVNQIIKNKDQSLVKKYHHIHEMLLEMYQLSKTLQKRRASNGSLDFAISEAKIIVDQTGKAVDIKVRSQDIAEEIIEQFMIVANEAIASFFSTMELPFIYRIHGTPKDTKLDAFRQVANTMGVNVSTIKNTSALKPKALQNLLANIHQKDEYNLLSTLLLRTMQKAEYSTNNIGHFGLAMRNYTHFTSPIRRYPDLIVHRLIRHFIFNEKQYHELEDKLLTELKEIAHETSVAERKAIDCERAVTNMKMAEYMHDHVGETFKGVISGVVNSGFFVELENLVEGKVAVESLNDDYYIFMPEQMLLFGRRTKKQFRMGDKVEIEVESANKEIPEINFVLTNFKQGKHPKIQGVSKTKKEMHTKPSRNYQNKKRGGKH